MSIARTPTCFWVEDGTFYGPCVSAAFGPAGRSSQLTATPEASRTRRVASATSGPIPSPGIRVTPYVGIGAILSTVRGRSDPTAIDAGQELVLTLTGSP